ncbi:MAG: L-seryl-tRNA(Sec) selenium transferase [Myxococcales bacterium]|nr:L-seryl-tRNA(Sec) selenium transferase [Myxococcales bacterium]
MSAALLSALPKVDRVLEAGPLADHRAARALKRRLVQEAVEGLRRRLLAGESVTPPSAEALAREVAARLDALLLPRPRRVLNGTGVVLHTNLGRAPLAGAVVDAMVAAAGACDLEIDLESGQRGSRFAHLRPLLAAVVGAEDVHVVNNGAAALLLATSALGLPGGVALSRGQMIEIGDSFRVAEMAAAAGARVWEVGSTNRTHLADYRRALGGELAGMSAPVSALLWAHRSNFRQEGFVAEVELAELAALARSRGVPLIADLGSGSLGVGIPGDEPTIAAYLADGVDLVTCSGDKLFGGPQAGIIAGRAELVARLRRHPMARALRPDKVTLAALHATIAAHACEGTPALALHALLGASVDDLRGRARAIVDALAWPATAIRSTVATIGGGSLPGDTLPGVAIAVPGGSPARLARRLRLGDPPVVGRVVDDTLLVDLRALPASDDDDLIAALRALASAPG